MPELVAYRLAAWDTPFWVRPNRGPARYHDAMAGPTQYLSLHPLGPWAEHLRAHGIREPERLAELRLRLWAVRLEADRVQALDFDSAEQHGLRPADLVSDDHGACRAFADRVRLDPSAPVVWRVPSAALPGTRNLVIFGPRVASAYGAPPIDPEVDLPAAVAADRATTIEGLLARVRHRGERHAELEAWRRGRAYRLEEPTVA